MRALLVPFLTWILAACAATPGDPAAESAAVAPPAGIAAPADALAGTYWKLVEADGGGILQQNAAGSGVTLAFADGKVSGRDGCNRYTGSYALQQGKLLVGRIASTKMFCAGAAGEVETAFLAWLQQPLERLIDAADLRLRGETDGVTLVFVADAVPARP